jgi:hypothetical protein
MRKGEPGGAISNSETVPLGVEEDLPTAIGRTHGIIIGFNHILEVGSQDERVGA